MKKIIIYMQAYNGEKYLKQCIESVLMQTYKNFIFYIIDNGSQDGSPQIIKEYAEEDHRIVPMLYKDNNVFRWMEQIDELDEEDYFTFIDHDDWWKENYLELLVDFLEENELDLSACSALFYSENKKKYFLSNALVEQPVIILKNDIAESYWQFRLFFASMWGCIMKVRLLKITKPMLLETKGKTLNWGGDTLCILEYIKNCNRIGIINESLYVYRMSDNNSSSFTKFNEYRFPSIVALINEYRKFCEETKLYNAEKVRMLSLLYLNNISEYFKMIRLSELAMDKQVDKYNEVFRHKLTIESLANLNALYISSDFKNEFVSIVQMYTLENIEYIRNTIMKISPKSSIIFTKENFECIQRIPGLISYLVDDNTYAAILILVPYLEYEDVREQIFKMVQSLLDKGSLINTISNPEFLLYYQEIIENLLYMQLNKVFDEMTDLILTEKNIMFFEDYINLYINLSAVLEIEMGFLVGKLKLAWFLYNNNNTDEAKVITKELLEFGLVSDELDHLVLELSSL